MLAMTVLLFLCLYATFVVYVLIRLFLHKPLGPASSQTGDHPSLSVVIPFKNEAHNLDALCASLADQDYGGEWEVVLVNDGSDDDFATALTRFRDRLGVRFSCVDSHFDPSKPLTSKQQAIDKGIEAATYAWVALTDADMTFARDWLARCAAGAHAGTDMAFGHTAIQPQDHGFFARCQRFQLEFLFASAYAFHAAGLDGSCMGNNILIRKKAYQETGGQHAIGRSIVEDRDLYREFKRRGRAITAFEPFEACAFTAPCATIPQFYHQMLRWTRGGFSSSPLLFFAALAFSFQNISLFAAVSGTAPCAVTCLSAANFLMTMFFAGLAFKKISSRENVLFLPVYLVFALAEGFVFFFSFVITPRVKWKNRKV
jgi:cellulose synthase/poly-beta-1,6-N-acetylglucosamine synthase-like glycosyltransferase